MSTINSGKNTVVVTGFGPFGCHTVNASWEAVKLLPKMLDADGLGIALVVEEIPVEYDETLTRIQKLQEKHKPMLMIHVGVSHKAQELTLESCASKRGYDKADVKGNTPSLEECCIGNNLRVSTNLAIEKLAAELNNLKIGVSFCTSDDAGLYLCEFSYYTSLCVNGQNSLFVHVPDIGKPYTPEESARGLCEIIRLAIAHIADSKDVSVCVC